MVLTLKKSYFYAFPALAILALLSLFTSIFFQIHLGKPADFEHIFDISFYHVVPLLLWIIYLPFILRLILRFPLKGTQLRDNLPKHILISLAFAPAARLIAITLDFWIKKQIGMIEVPVLSLVMDVKWVILGSIPKELLMYWLVVLTLSYLEKKGETNYFDKLVLDSSSGSRIISSEKVIRIEADKNYVVVHTSSERIRSRTTFKNLSKYLAHNFIQVHRSKIINKNEVSSLKHWRNGEYLITLSDGSHVTSTRTFLQNVKSLTS